MEDSLVKKPAIIITVYDRSLHIKRCLESLELAAGSQFFHVIIGSDAPAHSKHRQKVDQVRSYLSSKEGSHKFGKLSIIYHEKNVSERENVKCCHCLSKKFGHENFIRMEDDVIVGVYFLDYMVDALHLYSHESDIIAINGYLDPNIEIINSEPFLYNRFNAYGYGSWYRKWDKVTKRLASVNYAEKALSDVSLFRKQAKLTKNAKSYPFIAEEYYRAADLEIGLMMEVEHLWVLKPNFSLTANKGLDGSGLRSGCSPIIQGMEPCNVKVHVPSPIEVKRILVNLAQNKIPIRNIIINWMVYFIYKKLPAGFLVLKGLRIFKKSL